VAGWAHWIGFVNILSYDITFLTNLVAGNHEFYTTLQNILPVEEASGGYARTTLGCRQYTIQDI